MIQYIKTKFSNYLNSGKIYNLIILLIEIVIITFITVYKHISFGLGYEDLLWRIVMYLALLFHLKITWSERHRSNLYFAKLATFFLVFWILICLEITIWHDVLVRWYGKLA